MTIELRPAGPQDADAIAALFGAARCKSMDYLPRLHTADEDRAFFAGVIADGHTTVALHKGHVVGFIALGEARVEHLYVEPASQRRQIGTALLRHAQATRPAGLDLWVFQRNTFAIAFYERHGFRVAELTDGEDNEEREPDARMVWAGA